MYDLKSLSVALIKQLPKDHEGRNSFIMNHSDCDEAKLLKVEHILRDLTTTLEQKVVLIDKVYYTGDKCEAPSMPRVQSPQYPQRQNDKW